MKLRDFGTRSGFQIPRVNVGAMRLPKDVDEAVGLIRHAIDSGMRYIDTSRGYGESEWLLGKALKDGYRGKVILSTKWSPWITKIQAADDTSADCTRRRLEESMMRLDVDYLDFYQLWNIDSREHYDQATGKGGMLEGILKAKDEGLIGHTGFTTHDSVENLLEYLNEADWCEILLTTFNLLNQEYGPVMEAAHQRGIGTIVMNPVGGGKLTEESPVLKQLAAEVGAESVPDLAIRFVLSQPFVDTIISGISRLSDVDDTVSSAGKEVFDSGQMKVIADFMHRLTPENVSFCTACKYCMPCPHGIDIPTVMGCIYDDRFLGLADSAASRYGRIKSAKADACVECGECEEKCTQHLPIMTEMKFAVRRFGENSA